MREAPRVLSRGAVLVISSPCWRATNYSEVVVEAQAPDDAEGEGGEGERGAGFEEDAALGQASVHEAELATHEGVDGHVDAGADAETEAAADVDVDGGGAGVDVQIVEGVQAKGEAATDVVVASVDAHTEVRCHVLDTEVKCGTRVTDAETSPVTGLSERGAGAEGGDSDQGNQELAHSNPPNRNLRRRTNSSPARLYHGEIGLTSRCFHSRTIGMGSKCIGHVGVESR